MKTKLLGIITFLLVAGLFFGTFVFAQSASPTPTGSLNDAESLKDKIASKVAELQKKDERAYAGTIIAIADTTIKIQADGTQYQVKVDKDLTKIFAISGGAKKDANLSDLSKGDYIITTGPLSDHVVSANTIYVDEQIFQGIGKITEVNSANFYLKVTTPEKDIYTLDIETYTKKYLLDAKTLSIDPTTLAKIKEGDTVEFVYKKTGKETEKNRYSMEKFFVIPQEYFAAK